MADLRVKVKADTSNLNKAMTRAGRKVGNLGSQMEKTGSTLSKAVSGPLAGAAAAVGGLAVKAGRAADRLLDIEQQTGLATDTIQEYDAVADRAGVSTQAITGAAEMLNQRMRQLKSDSSNASRAFEELGIATKNQKGELRDNSVIFQEAIDKLSGLENQTKRNKIASQLFGNRWSELAPVLGMGSEQIQKTRQEAQQLGQVMSEDQIKAANKFRQSFDKIGRSVSVLFNKLGAELAPVMQETIIPVFKNQVIPALKSTVSAISTAANKFNNLPEPVKSTAMALTGLAIALPPVAMGAGKILKIAPKAFRAMAASAKISAATTRRALMSTGIGALAVAIGYGVSKAIQHWDKLTSFFEGTGLAPMFKTIGSVAKDALEIVVGAFVATKRKITPVITGIKDIFYDSTSALGEIARDAVSLVVTSFKQLYDRVSTVFSGVTDIIGSVIGYVKNSFEFWYDLLTGDITGAMDALERAVKYMGLGVINAMDTMISTIIESIADFTYYIDKAFGTDMAGALDNASDKVSQFAEQMKGKLGMEEQQKQIDDTKKSLMDFGGALEGIGEQTLSGFGGGESEKDGGSEGSDQSGTQLSKGSKKTGGKSGEMEKQEAAPGMAEMIPEEKLKQQLKNVQKAMEQQRIAEIWEGVGNRISAAGEAMSKSFTKQAKMAGQSAKSMAQFAAKLGNAVSDSISAFIAEGVTAVVSGALKSSSLLGPAAVPIAASAGAAAQALFSSIVPEFAQGGGVKGETVAKLGDYPGAYANPEVAMRMDQIQRMIDGGNGRDNGGQDVEFVMDGEKLKGVQNSNTNRKRRMGL